MFHAYAADKPKGLLKPFSYEPGPLKPDEVEIEISHCGICHSDVHMLDNDWGMAQYPLVPGHEIVGRVTLLGEDVKHLKKGIRVGVGWQSGSCNRCEWCFRGEETCCPEVKGVLVGRHGGFADRVRVSAKFALPIPDALDPAGAAPLLCGGVTVYTPLRVHARPAHRVGVIGIGGLGHLAVQFASAMGCEVTAFSTTASKKKEAGALGAHHFVVSSDAKQMAKQARSLDVLVSAVTADLKWASWMDTLRPKGKLVIVGASPRPIEIPAMSLISGSRGVVGSMIGDPSGIAEMLDFSSRHKIKAQVEVVPMKKVNPAMDRVRQSKARYRVVLEN